MDLDELRARARATGAPAPAGPPWPDGPALDRLIDTLKTEDAVDRRRARRLGVLFGIAAVSCFALFTLTWILPPDGGAAGSRLALALFTGAFLTVWQRSHRAVRELSGRDYTVPVATFLAEAERNHRFLAPQDLWLGVIVVTATTLGAGAAWSSAGARYLPTMAPATRMELFAGFWALVLTTAVICGWVDWRRRRAQRWQDLKRLRAELSHEEAPATEVARATPPA